MSNEATKSNEDAMKRLGAHFTCCEWCQRRFVVRYTLDFDTVNVFGDDGELTSGGAVVCSKECAEAWAKNFNESTDRTNDNMVAVPYLRPEDPS